MTRSIRRLGVLIVALLAFHVGAQNLAAADAAAAATASAEDAIACEIACALGTVGCCLFVEGGCYFCFQNGRNCVSVCLALPI